jgi:hypothetical protein
MSQSSGSPGRGDVTWPDGDPWSNPAGSPPGGRPPPGGWPPPPADRAHRPRRRNTLAVVATAVLGLLLGAGIALALTGGSPSGRPSAAGSVTTPSAGLSTPSAPSAGPSGSSGLVPGGSSGAVPGSAGGGSGFRMLFLGKITALSSSSVTLTAPGHTVTAELTKSSQVTGHLKVGDTVSAQIGRNSGGKYVATAIQDPPGLP